MRLDERTKGSEAAKAAMATGRGHLLVGRRPCRRAHRGPRGTAGWESCSRSLPCRDFGLDRSCRTSKRACCYCDGWFGRESSSNGNVQWTKTEATEVEQRRRQGPGRMRALRASSKQRSTKRANRSERKTKEKTNVSRIDAVKTDGIWLEEQDEDAEEEAAAEECAKATTDTGAPSRRLGGGLGGLCFFSALFFFALPGKDLSQATGNRGEQTWGRVSGGLSTAGQIQRRFRGSYACKPSLLTSERWSQSRREDEDRIQYDSHGVCFDRTGVPM